MLDHRRVTAFFVAMMAVFLAAGCASTGQAPDPNYSAMLQAYQSQPPLVEMTCPDGGCVFKSLKVSSPQSIPQRQPDAPHPAWSALNGLIRVGGVVGGIWAAGDALEGIIEAGRGISTYQSGGDMAVSGSTVANPVTTTTTTTNTETNTGMEPMP